MKRQYTFKTLASLLMVLFMLPAQVAWSDTWDGTTQTKPSGAGTEASPYVITSAAEFAWFGNNMGAQTTYFRLDTDIDLDNKEWKKGGNSSATFKGHFDGQGHTVSNVVITAVSGKNNGLFCNISGTNAAARAELKNLKIQNVTFEPTTIAAVNTRVGAIAGYTKWADISNVQVDGVSFVVNGDVTGTVYIAGAIGQMDNGQGELKGVTVENVSLAVNGTSGSTLYLGGLVGYAIGNSNQLVNIFNCKVKNANLSLTGNVTNTTFIGGAISMIGAFTAVDGLYVEGGSITGPTTTKTITNNKEFWVGGAVGKQNSSGVNLNQPNYIHNVAVSDMTIDLGKYEAAGVINNHKFGVGGVIGTVNAPNDDQNGRRGMPENLLFKGGKIYAPHAATSPTVANFGATIAHYNNYTGENYTSNIDCIEKSKAGTWLYSDYKLGLSPEFLAYEKIDSWNAAPAQNRWRKNFEDTKLAAADASGVRYLSVSDETFKKQNRRLDNERPSKTVLWWTNQANYNEATGAAAALFTENEQPIYPQYNFGTVGQAELVKFPYYMYFYQGVANAKYVNGTNADEIIKGIEANIVEAAKSTVADATPVTLTIADPSVNKRGFAAHTLTVTPSEGDAVDSYKWYVDGVEQDGATTNTLNLKPDWKTGKSVIVNAIKGGKVVASLGYALRVGVLQTKAGDTEEVGSDIFGRGTKTNPYIIDSPEALRQLSMLSTLNATQLWEGIVRPTATTNTGGVASQSQGHYNRAYYELGADIDLNSEPFIPISHVGTNGDGTDGTYTNNWIFQGNFDGKGHKISNLNVTWSSGNINYNNYNQYWGLFGAIGHKDLTAKWGDGTATSNTVVRNLVIDGATFTHDTNNKTFYYGNGSITTTNANRAMVGVLAGMVNSNTTFENIEIRKSSITDEGSSDYDLATQGLYVGGAIGSMQYAYGTESTMPINMTVRNIVADVDITLTHPKFHDDSKPAEVGVFNIGGIIGRIIATSQATTIQTIMPSYTFFKGKVNAPKAWISPVVGSMRYSNQQAVNYANYTKHWEGNNGTAETQHTITNAAYYKYFITVDGVSKLITENYPDEDCGLGSRTVKKHIDGSYSEQKDLQGVNYNAKYISSEDAPFDIASGKILAIGMLNDGLAKQSVTEFTWKWNATADMPSMHLGSVTSQEYAYLTRGTGTDLNSMRIVTSYVNATYKWQKYDGSVWTDISDETAYAYIATPDKSVDEYYRAIVVENATEHITQVMMVKFVPLHSNFRIDLAPATDNNVYSIVVTGDAVASGQTMTTQWYKADGTTLFTDGAGVTIAGNTLTLSDAIKAENKKIFCLVTVTDNSNGKTLLSQMVSYYNEGRVVYLMLATDNTSVHTSSGVIYNSSNAGANTGSYTYETATYGKTPDKPVNSWAGAYALLTEYTPEAITKGGYNNKQIKIDDGKNLVTVDDNIIVVMGLAKDKYFDNENGVDGTVASKPATVTGKWDGVDYHGCICNTTDNLSLNADHKFENIGFSISSSGRYRIYAHRWNVHMAKGILMGYEAGLAAGKDDANNYKVNYADGSTGTPIGHRAADIAVMGGYQNDGTSNNPEKNEYVNHGRKEGQIIRLESGLWGPVCPGNRQTDECVSYYIMGGPENPAKTTFIIDLDQAWNDAHRQYKKGEFATLDVGCLLSGNHEGTMYADVVLDIRSGKMGRVVNGIKGSQRVKGQNTGFKTGSTNYRHIVRNIDSNGDPVDGTGIGSTTGSGTKWLYTSAPPPDSYIGRGVINISPAKALNYTGTGTINDRVSVVELYCGGLGRCHNDGYFHPEVATNFFGQSIVNIEGGTFYNTIYGAGAGGVNGIGTDDNHTNDNAIPFYPGGTTDYVWYAPYDYLKESGNLGNIVNVAYHNNEPLLGRNGTTMPTDGTVNLRDTYTFINITGGVFGSKSSPVSIYAGGSGETNDGLINMVDAPATTDIKNSVQTPNRQAGCIFGNGEGVASEIRISNATIYGNIYGGGKGSAKYFRWISLTPTTTPDNIINRSNYETTAFQDYTRMSQPANYATYLVKSVKKLRSKADNYLNLGQVYGDTKITIGDNAVIHGNVFGGGEGVADMTQEDFIAGTGMTLTLDNANLNISNMTDARTAKQWVNNTIAGKQYISFPDMGKVFGKAQVNIEDGAIIHGNVYGGGDAGSIKGVAVDGSGNPIVARSSEVNIKGGEVYGSVFGAGKGLTIDKAAHYDEVATIIGEATVNLTGGTIWQNVYGGGQNAVVNGDTHFNMSGGSVAANVYGGGMGNVNGTTITRANIYGNTNVNITGGRIVWDRTSVSGETIVPVTVYRYMRTVPVETVTGEEYETTESKTASNIQTEYESLGYTSVTASSNGNETREGITYYKWLVNYTIPAHEEHIEYDYAANPEGYVADVPATRIENRKLTTGEVINWNINDPLSTYYANFYDEANGRFRIEHNIFGGGYLACNVGKYVDGNLVANTGTANVTMTKGLFGNDLIRTRQWKTAYNDHEYPHFYVFGGGYGVHTMVDRSEVYIALPAGEDKSSGTDQQLVGQQRVSEGDETIDIVSDAYGLPEATVLGVLGGGYNGQVASTNVLVADATFTHRVYGGGLGTYNGWVEVGKPATEEAARIAREAGKGSVGTTGNTHVVIAGGHIYGDVFGAGAGVAPFNESNPESTDNSTFTDFTEIARTTGNTSVEIYSYLDYCNKLYRDSLYLKSKDVITVTPQDPATYLTEAQKKMTGSIYGSVYGGGDVANVTGNTSVNFIGGNTFGYGVGAGYGRQAHAAKDYKTIGYVSGSTQMSLTDSIMYRINDGEEKTGYLVVDEERKAYVWNDIYGGGRNGLVGADTHVDINGGYFAGNIYGGGLGNDVTQTFANIGGQTHVLISGGNIVWDRKSDINGNIKRWTEGRSFFSTLDVADAWDATLADPGFIDSSDPKHPAFIVNHNIYGGGNLACVVAGKLINVGEPNQQRVGTEVVINKSPVADRFIVNEQTRGGQLWKRLMQSGKQAQFSVFGGGYGENTQVGTAENPADAVVNMKVGYNVALAGGWDAAFNSSLLFDEEDRRGGTLRAELANFYPAGRIIETSTGNITSPPFIRPNYTDAEKRLRVAVLAKRLGIAGNSLVRVVGGGYNGSIQGNTFVTVDGNSHVGNVFGGGLGSEGSSADAAQVTKDAHVTIQGGATIYADVFAGGAGVESTFTPDDILSQTGTYTDHPDIARVKGNTFLTVEDNNVDGEGNGIVTRFPIVGGSVYGGGDVANVGTLDGEGNYVDKTGKATTVIAGGHIMRYLFGGGNGRLTNYCADYTKIGSVKETDVTIKRSEVKTESRQIADEAPFEAAAEPYLWDHVYAGGRNGLVNGSTAMDIYGGQFVQNIFGGGWGAITDSEGNVLTDDNGLVNPEYAGKALGTDYFVTSADVKGNTNIIVRGGSANIDQLWDHENHKWEELIYDDNGEPYTPQYDFVKTVFNIQHNIYTGGNLASNIGTLNNEGVVKPGTGNTNITMYRGMLNNQYFESFGTPFLESWEWRDIYAKHGTPFFCIFGGGFGENAAVFGDTHVKVDLIPDDLHANKDISPTETETGHNHTVAGTETITGCSGVHDRTTMNYTKFPDGQSVMDIVGGGFNGSVNGTCNITVDGQPFIRNIFGGAYYSSVGGTNVNVLSGNIDNVYGGGMMGDVNNQILVNVGSKTDAVNDNQSKLPTAAQENARLLILGDVYGGNDVSGLAGAKYNDDGSIDIENKNDGVQVQLYGGNIRGNVYGAGNGNYLYMVTDEVSEITADEQYPVDASQKTRKLVYKVPMRSDGFASFKSSTSVQRIVNISSYRPVTIKTAVTAQGNSDTDRLKVDGYVFGGGNAATVSDYAQHSDDPGAADYWKKSSVELNIGSHVDLGRVYFGSDGDALFADSAKNDFLREFPYINNITFTDAIDWLDPAHADISTRYLNTPKADRPDVYKNLLDLYFMPVEMYVVPKLTWADRFTFNPGDAGTAPQNTPTAVNTLTDASIGTFCCGGNRGSMSTRDLVDVVFPEGLTIKGGNIVGGCYNANYYYNRGREDEVSHVGGYLLGTHGSGTPQIKLTVGCKFQPNTREEAYVEGCNVYGACFSSGTIRGDVSIDMRSNILDGLDSVKVRNMEDNHLAIGNVYGAGYGMLTYVYGNTEVLVGNNSVKAANNASVGGITTIPQPTKAKEGGHEGEYSVDGTSVNYVFGGGQRGNVIGNSNIHVLNGRIGGSVVGGSYAGNLYGNTNVMVGYPRYYQCNRSAEYKVLRKDDDPVHLAYTTDGTQPLIKQSIKYLKNSFISEAIYQEIDDWYRNTPEAGYNIASDFTLQAAVKPADYGWGWEAVGIQIDKAVYGGGYALTEGSGLDASAYTVKCYNDKYNLNDFAHTVYGFAEDSYTATEHGTIGFGGNTNVMMCDHVQDNDNTAPVVNDVAFADEEAEHITLSSEQLEPVTVAVGQSLFGLYHYQDGVYYYHATEELKKEGDVTKYYRYTGEGGLFGDGHLSLTEGFRFAEVTGYGYAAHSPSKAKLMNCIHRFDIVRLKDCCVAMLGDRDYASEQNEATNATPYSLSRIGELQMVSSIDDSGALNTQRTVDGRYTQKKSRNYIGLSNNVRNIGCVYSNVSFAEGMNHDDNGALTGGDTYHDFKLDKIDRGYDYQLHTDRNIDIFRQRNNGTAKNLIGISSGYALSIQDAHCVPATGSQETSYPLYYGPIHGVVEIGLLNVAAGEGGGFVYAQNRHEKLAGGAMGETPASDGVEAGANARPSGMKRAGEAGAGGMKRTGEAGENARPSFMLATGNFVFPKNQDHWIFDECYPVDFGWSDGAAHSGDDHSNDDSSEGHYWYVTGYNYLFYADITGFTSDDGVKKFYMVNTDNLIKLIGTQRGEPVQITDFKFMNNQHSDGYNCDIDKYLNGGTAPNAITDSELVDPAAPKGYTLSLSLATGVEQNENRYADHYTRLPDGSRLVSLEDWTYTNPETSVKEYFYSAEKLNEYYYTKSGDDYTPIPLADAASYFTDGLLKEGAELYTRVPYHEQLTKGSDPYTAEFINGVTDSESALISLRLTDNVRNNGFDEHDVPYMKGKLDEDCKFMLRMQTIAKDKDGKISMVDNFEKVTTGTGDKFILEQNTTTNEIKLISSETAETGYTKIAFNGSEPAHIAAIAKWDGRFRIADPAGSLHGITGQNALETYYTPADGGWTYNSSKGEIFRASDTKVPQKFTYTVYVTVHYVQGPSYTGDITIGNCALPGEMIALTSTTLTIRKDQDFPLNGAYWTFGPLKPKTDASGVIKDGSGDVEEWVIDESSANTLHYNPDPTQEGSQDIKSSPILTEAISRADVDINDTRNIAIPAFYFMNGYGVEYSFYIKGIADPFHVKINPANRLDIHNYHEVTQALYDDKSSAHASANLLIQRAAEQYGAAVTVDDAHYLAWSKPESQSEADYNTEVKQWGTRLAAPRMYINNDKGMRMFMQFVDTISTEESADHYVHTYGKDIDFHLRGNVTMRTSGSEAYTPLAGRAGAALSSAERRFDGVLHGNGYTVTNSSSLSDVFGELHGRVYNLGVSGVSLMRTAAEGSTIANSWLYGGTLMSQAGATMADDCKATLQNCFIYDSSMPNSKVEITADAGNSQLFHANQRAFASGNVAYNVNGYYLNKRSVVGGELTTDAAFEGYVEELFRNGDYRYAGTDDENEMYLRTATVPNFGQQLNFDFETTGKDIRTMIETRHDKSHPIDKPHAVLTEGAMPGDKVLDYYAPLYEAAEQVPATWSLDTKKNDYIFFGQTMSPGASGQPAAIRSKDVGLMLNRVYRAMGYYGSKTDSLFHFNGNASVYKAAHPSITAVDFRGWNDTSAWAQGQPSDPAENPLFFYRKIIDIPQQLGSFVTDENTTRNLLVYTDGEHQDVLTNYTELTAENRIRYHVVKPQGEVGRATELLHLVERVSDQESPNDFNAPFAFDVTRRAWYTRRPMSYSTTGNNAWEGICLPFGVNKVEASVYSTSTSPADDPASNGELTHFYGFDDPTLGEMGAKQHEYWLRDLQSITNASPGTVPQAAFQRPAAGTTQYIYNNNYFKQTYGDAYSHNHAKYAGTDYTLEKYAFEKMSEPYIVAFPGRPFYEFDLSGNFYWKYFKTAESVEQAVTFNYLVGNVKTPGMNAVAKIRVTDDEQKVGEVKDGYALTGTYQRVGYLGSGAENAVYTLNANGTAFRLVNDGPAYNTAYVNDVNGVLPFRACIRPAVAGSFSTGSFGVPEELPGTAMLNGNAAQNDFGVHTRAAEPYLPEEIIIALGKDDTIAPIIIYDEDSDEDSEGDARMLKMYIFGHDLVIESNYETNLRVYTTAGQYIMTLHVVEGVNTYQNFQRGIYIIGNQKVEI